MATKLEHLDLEIQHFNQFVHLLPGIQKCCKKTVNHLLELGVIQVSSAFEHALARSQGTSVVSKNTHDLASGADAKLSSVRVHKGGEAYGAPVGGISGKTGTLLVQVYERKQNKFYYFKIPHRAYRHISSSSNIEIPFELDGTPRRIPLRSVMMNWWRYEVPTLL
jgi:hypothetical protein